MRPSDRSSQQPDNFKRYKLSKEMNDSAASDHSKDPLYSKFEKSIKISNEASKIEESQASPEAVENENNNNENTKSLAEKKEPSSSPLLKVVESTEQDPMNHSQSRALISYKIEGNDGVKYVSDLYLQQRVVNIRSQTAAKQKSILSQASKESIKPIEQSSESSSQEEEFRRPMRYFDEINPQKEEKNAIKCFRCGKRGHIAKNCLQQKEKTKCMYCLGEHHHHDCNARACFRCNELGHVAQQCRTNAVECHKCKKRGHVQKNCGAVLVMDYTKFGSDKQFRQFYNTEDLRRLRCLNACKVPFGHFNCYEYKDDKQKPYQKEEPKEKKAAREKQRQRDRDRDRQRERQRDRDRDRERQREREREKERQRDRDRDRSGHKNRDWKISNSRVDPNKIAHENSKYSGMAFTASQIQPQLPQQQIPPAIIQPPYMNYGYPNMPMNAMPPMGQPQPQPSPSAPYYAANPYAAYPPYAPPPQNYPGGYSYPNDPYGRPMPQRGPYPDYRSNFDQQNPQKW